MTDFDFSTALTGFTAVSTALKSLSGIAKDLKADGKSTEITARIIELHGLILDLQSKMSSLILENQELKSLVRDKDRAFDTERSLTYIENAYWRVDPNKGEADGPFCLMCWDLDGKLGRMIADSDGGGHYSCYHHKLNIRVKTAPTAIDLR